MSVWRYKAVPLAGAGEVRSGELAAGSAAEVRASLRRIGLQVVELRPARHAVRVELHSLLGPARDHLDRHLRARRGARRGEVYDSLATMLDAGVPLVEAVSTVAGGQSGRSSSSRRMLLELRETLRGGSTLAEAMRSRPSWYDPAEVAMVEAGQVTGELAEVLRSLGERQHRAGELTGKLAAALAYPAIVTCVGLGVVVFLSVKTLPDLVTILHDAGVGVPRLTAGVMAFGRGLITVGPWALAAIAIGLFLLVIASAQAKRRGIALAGWTHRLTPGVVRRAAVAEAMLGLAEMVRTGVPVVDAMRVLTPTFAGPFRGRLGGLLNDAAEQIERGSSLSESLPEGRWFDRELLRLIEIGESSGELPEVLQRVAERQRRAARRAIDRLAAMLEPAVILLLACFVGLVVLSAVLPLVRLQEVL